MWLYGSPQVLLDSLLNLQPRTEGDGGGATGAPRREDVVMAIATDLLEQVPQHFNLEEVMKAKADDPSALHVVLFQVGVGPWPGSGTRMPRFGAGLGRQPCRLPLLLDASAAAAVALTPPRPNPAHLSHDPQEVERYNALLVAVRRSCLELQRGIRGLVVMSADLDQVFEALYAARVPAAWLKTYPSLKPLGPWTRDLLQRIEQLATWVEETYPRVYWLSGFTYPTGAG